MPRWPSLLSCAGLACLVTLRPLCALAQSDLPPSEPPAAPPAEPAPPTAPPAEPPAAPAPSDPAPPVAPAPPPVAPAPPAGAFPLPAPTPTPPAEKKPPASSFEESSPTPAPGAAETPRPARATEGLFEEKPRAEGEVRPYKDEKEEDETDHFKIGPIVGTGIPSVLSIGGTLKLTRFLGAGANIGIIPKVALSYYGDATLSYQHYDIYGRIYPLGGGFFLQGGAGYATVDGTLQKKFDLASFGIPGVASASYESHGSVRTLMLTALIGYFYTTSIGFSFGIDAGAQIPIAPSQIDFESTVNTQNIPAPLVNMYKEQYITPTDNSVRSTLEKIGRTTLPTVNLRLGWIL